MKQDQKSILFQLAFLAINRKPESDINNNSLCGNHALHLMLSFTDMEGISLFWEKQFISRQPVQQWSYIDFQSRRHNLGQPESCQNSDQASCQLLLIIRSAAESYGWLNKSWLLEKHSLQLVNLFQPNYNEGFQCLTFWNYFTCSDVTVGVFPSQSLCKVNSVPPHAVTYPAASTLSFLNAVCRLSSSPSLASVFIIKVVRTAGLPYTAKNRKETWKWEQMPC